MRTFKVIETEIDVYIKVYPEDFSDLPFTGTPAEAVELAIKKWEAMVDYYKEGGQSYIRQFGESTCALCSLCGEGCFHSDVERCPVYKRTGYAGCEETPYKEYMSTHIGSSREERLKICQEEVIFLKSLRQEEK